MKLNYLFASRLWATLILLQALLSLPSQAAASELFCVTGDALDTVSVILEDSSKSKDHVQLSMDYPSGKQKLLKAILEKGSYLKMLGQGRFQIVFQSSESIEHGGAVSHAALASFTRENTKDKFHGLLASDGSVHTLTCTEK